MNLGTEGCNPLGIAVAGMDDIDSWLDMSGGLRPHRCSRALAVLWKVGGSSVGIYKAGDSGGAHNS